MYTKKTAFSNDTGQMYDLAQKMKMLDEMYFEVVELTAPVQYIDSCWGFLFIIIYLCDPDF